MKKRPFGGVFSFHSIKPEGQNTTGLSVDECKCAQRAPSEARNVKTGATGRTRGVSTSV